jgi:hypothetical protein
VSPARAALVALAALAAAGCHVPVGTLRTLAADPPPARPLASLGAARGTTCRWWVLGVPLGLPHLDDAVRDAVAARGGVLLRDAHVFSVHPVWLFVGRHCYTVEGEVLG